MKTFRLACVLSVIVCFSAIAQPPTPSPLPTATPTRTPTPIPTPTGFPAWILTGEKVTAEIVNRPGKQVFASFTSEHHPNGTHKFSAVQPAPTATPFDFPTPLPTATPITLPTPFPTPTPFDFPTPLPTATPITLPTPLPTATPFSGSATALLPIGYDSVVFEWVSNSSITVKAGSQALSADGTVSYTISADTTVSLPGNLANGLSEAANSKYRLWIGKNTAGNDELVLSPSESTVPNQVGTAAALLHPRLLRWCLRNNASSNLLSFQIEGHYYRYLSAIALAGSDETQIFNGTSPTANQALDVSAFVPAGRPASLLILSDAYNEVIIGGYQSKLWINDQLICIGSSYGTATTNSHTLGGQFRSPYSFQWKARWAFTNTRISADGFWEK